MLWDLLQQHKIIGLETRLKSTQESSQEYIAKIATSIDDRFSKLTLVCEAMWQLLMEHTDLTEEDLVKKVTDLDLMDGVLDGKLNRNLTQGQGSIKECPNCGAGLSKKFNRCLFCGYQDEGNANPFSTLD